jgi:16S rRNA (cytosine967-C5)-methyltransferase
MTRHGRTSDPRALAHNVTKRVLYHGAFADIALGSALAESALPPADRRLATELVYGTVRRLLTIDWALDGLLRKPVSSAHPDLATALRLGAYQILYLDRVPDYASVDRAVAITRAKAGGPEARVTNAVLRRLARDGPRPLPAWDDRAVRLAVEHSHPVWLVRRLLSTWTVAEASSILAANNVPPPLEVWVNTLKAGRATVARSLETEGYATRPGRFTKDCLVMETGGKPVEESKAFRDGLFYVMDEAAMLVAPALGAEPGSTVLDACAAPGGKSVCLAASMNNRGRVLAIDLSEARVALIQQNCERMGAAIVEARQGDARDAGGMAGAPFDYVLVDAPCSGLGVLRRRPDLRWRKDLEQVEGLRRLQQEILRGAAAALKQGGILLYCTCSIHPDENRGAIESFLRDHQHYRMTSLRGLIPPELELDEDNGTLQLYTHVHGTDGFYIARMVKMA